MTGDDVHNMVTKILALANKQQTPTSAMLAALTYTLIVTSRSLGGDRKGLLNIVGIAWDKFDELEGEEFDKFVLAQKHKQTRSK